MLKQYIIYERFCIIYNILQLYSTSDSLNEKGLILDWIDSMTLKVRVEIQFILSEYVQLIFIRAFSRIQTERLKNHRGHSPPITVE